MNEEISMKARIATTAIVAGAIVFALLIGRANAKSDKESCKETSAGTIENTNPDGTQCSADVSGSGSNEATAEASKLGLASAVAENGSTASAKDSGRPGASRCVR
jgi:hypothetical protein